ADQRRRRRGAGAARQALTRGPHPLGVVARRPHGAVQCALRSPDPFIVVAERIEERGGTMAGTRTDTAPEAGEGEAARNEGILWGRLAADAEERTLPSGDSIATLRMVIPRRGGPPRPKRSAGPGPRRATVDTIDIVCWSAATRRAALRLHAGDA